LNQQSMQTRAYSICRTCSGVYPSEMRCGSCHGDARAVATVAAAIAQAHGPLAPREAPRGMKLATTFFAATLLAGVTTAVIASLVTM
jgi:hypothetical protein